ncbi:hypothetical protein DOTSEDRAFT_66568 [Dothistroma septosporum NZE10]|uniref:Uncharacterized protein n=1 Tax=Dothistroma septosporum (strain NZE10 / CBS 128990) TaxID=675120 RepID=M2YL59_DOTSN|nr:hypothetical protein DOTSEDRAFT_66568 [Dothistroma septosporum NZE10]
MDEESNVSSGNKSGTPVESIDFRFLNFTNPKDAKDASTRRSVRSHVTSKQHEKQRKRAAAEQARRDQVASSPDGFVSPTLQVPDSRRTSYVESSGPSETSSPEDSSPAPSASSPPPLTRINPLDMYPEEWHPYLRPIMDHYIESMSIDLPETDSASRALLRDRFLSLVFSDPAPLHALILTAAAHWSKLRPDQQHQINLLQLRGMAIQEINRAMADHGPNGRATSDVMIAAVGKMATYELLFGDRNTFHTHMTGLQRMISLRGGLPQLGADGLLERILLWIDSNASDITNGALYFPSAAFSSTNGHPRPDRRLFLMGLQSS